MDRSSLGSTSVIKDIQAYRVANVRTGIRSQKNQVWICGVHAEGVGRVGWGKVGCTLPMVTRLHLACDKTQCPANAKVFVALHAILVVVQIARAYATPARPLHLSEVLLHARFPLLLDEFVQLLLSVK